MVHSLINEGVPVQQSQSEDVQLLALLSIVFEYSDNTGGALSIFKVATDKRADIRTLKLLL